MATHRFEVEASAGPGRCSVLSGRAMLLVRLRLFDGPDVVDGATGLPAGEEDVYSDLRPDEARRLAGRLLACAEQAERITEQAGWWQR